MAEMRLPPGARSRRVDGVNGLCMHILEAGYDASERPCILLLHGFPELAYSWRKLLLPLAELGFYVVAPDQRGYGQTTGWDGRFDGDWRSFHLLNIVRDKLALIDALGIETVHTVIGHDFGSPVAAYCSLIRPDIFRSVVMMSAPFGGTPVWSAPSSGDEIHTNLAALEPPRKHYQWYYSTSSADSDMRLCPQGIHAFLRAYFHVKSADWPGNEIYPLTSWTASELAKLPTYYVMHRDQTMAECVAPNMPNADAIAACQWLPDSVLHIYSDSFSKTGFQGGLNWYRCMTDPAFDRRVAAIFETIDRCPVLFYCRLSGLGRVSIARCV